MSESGQFLGLVSSDEAQAASKAMLPVLTALLEAALEIATGLDAETRMEAIESVLMDAALLARAGERIHQYADGPR